MADEAPQTHSGFDRTLLQRMIGQSGDRETLETKCETLAEVAAMSLSLQAAETIGVPIEVEFDAFEIGSKSELTGSFPDHVTVCAAQIGGWTSDITLCGSNIFVIAVMECMLGGSLPDDAKIEPRELSAIELDVATVIFRQLADSVRMGIASPPTDDVVTDGALAELPEPLEDEADPPSIMLRFELTVGPIKAPFCAVIAQRPILKATIVEHKEEKPPMRERPEWATKLTTQVSRSHILLDARIALSEITLGDVARLQIGDVLPFADEGAVRALLSAGDKQLFWCEFGKAGDRYTVRVQEPHKHDQELMRELAAG
ncbi:FliM/FliN family flagellar motor switch protein [Hoeflea prorocentri]|uniref:Flagellar motor switch protein FliM n=1 Tax=Hoeflea prorocentri TaxID=1922333 RepID=A0A9X3UKC1_9HYPH|nr:FliM/FliN family flagellar motor switch protein [Hoeflea prorocentri]MCY6382405.1 FliM/FliN family flagellar motor switch protein [Hoeflea prorocentri]MDA5400205.1 FliM/FliN family flagellar motor switch protein [Hoeflea prorocentri]